MGHAWSTQPWRGCVLIASTIRLSLQPSFARIRHIRLQRIRAFVSSWAERLLCGSTRRVDPPFEPSEVLPIIRRIKRSGHFPGRTGTSADSYSREQHQPSVGPHMSNLGSLISRLLGSIGSLCIAALAAKAALWEQLDWQTFKVPEYGTRLAWL
jgi:hypothetical protein